MIDVASIVDRLVQALTAAGAVPGVRNRPPMPTETIHDAMGVIAGGAAKNTHLPPRRGSTLVLQWGAMNGQTRLILGTLMATWAVAVATIGWLTLWIATRKA